MIRNALFSGTFDPFTIGHDAIVKRALTVAEKLIIGIAHNSEKKTLFTLQERLESISNLYVSIDNICVTSYEGLTVDYAKQMEIDFLIRGVRNLNDYEYEKTLAEVNRKLSGIETFFLFAEPAYAFVSSSLIRELILYNKDISNLIPPVK